MAEHKVEVLEMFVITTRTSDYGAKFVVRLHAIGAGFVAVGDPPIAVCDSLEEARGAIEEWKPSLVRLPSHPEDDPVIVETWV